MKYGALLGGALLSRRRFALGRLGRTLLDDHRRRRVRVGVAVAGGVVAAAVAVGGGAAAGSATWSEPRANVTGQRRLLHVGAHRGVDEVDVLVELEGGYQGAQIVVDVALLDLLDLPGDISIDATGDLVG